MGCQLLRGAHHPGGCQFLGMPVPRGCPSLWGARPWGCLPRGAPIYGVTRPRGVPVPGGGGVSPGCPHSLPTEGEALRSMALPLRRGTLCPVPVSWVMVPRGGISRCPGNRLPPSLGGPCLPRHLGPMGQRGSGGGSAPLPSATVPYQHPTTSTPAPALGYPPPPPPPLELQDTLWGVFTLEPTDGYGGHMRGQCARVQGGSGYGTIRYGMTQRSMVECGLTRYHMVWYGPVR